MKLTKAWALTFLVLGCAAESSNGEPPLDGQLPTPSSQAPAGGEPAVAAGVPSADSAPTRRTEAPPCENRPPNPGNTRWTFPDGRVFEVHAPKSYVPTKRTSVVFNVHGLLSDIFQQRFLTGMDLLSEERGFLVVYPLGLDSSWNAGACCGKSRDSKVDDVGYMRAVLAKVEQEFCVDPRRVFATGMSNGGFLVQKLACEPAPMFAAIAPVAGVLGIPDTECKATRPLPVFHVHGTADPLVPYPGGKPLNLDIGYNFRPVSESVRFWRNLDKCPAEPRVTFQKGDTRCETWGPCAEGSEVTLCTVDQGGHSWPGGFPVPLWGKTSTDLNASKAILDFFDAHPSPPGAVPLD